MTSSKVERSIWEKALGNAVLLVKLLCHKYGVPRARIALHPKWLKQIGARGAYFPSYHMLILPKLEIETKMDLLVVLHEFWHHCAHGIQHT